jgi:hypothetical protein
VTVELGESARNWGDDGDWTKGYVASWEVDVAEGWYDFDGHDGVGPDDPLLAELDVIDPVLEPSMMTAGSVTQAQALMGADAHEVIDRGQHWREPGECRCTSWDPALRRRVPKPHSGRATCKRCFLEFMSKSRKSRVPGKGAWVVKDPGDGRGARPAWDKTADGWTFDPHGEYGRFWGSAVIDGRWRSAAVRVPSGQWLVVMIEVIGTSVWQKSETERVPIQMIDIVGYHEARDQDEATLQAIELQQQWVLTQHASAGAWDNFHWSEKLGWLQSQDEPVPMGAALLSPQMLEQVADRPAGRTTGRRDSGE